MPVQRVQCATGIDSSRGFQPTLQHDHNGSKALKVWRVGEKETDERKIVNREKEYDIGKHSRVTLGVLWAVVVTTVAGAIGGVIEWQDLKHRIKDAWTVSDQQRWTFEFQKQNPGINVPEVQEEVVKWSTNYDPIIAVKMP